MQADSKIEIIPKPDGITFQQIKDLLILAHQSNREKGLLYGTTKQSAGELEARVKNGGVCYVALDKGRLIGTATVDFRDINSWYCKGRAAHFQMEGVHPDYKGMGIGSRLIQERMDFLAQTDVNVIYLTSAEKNIIVRDVYMKRGFKRVGYFLSKNDNFYSVIYVKWISECPFNDFYIYLRYIYSKWHARIRNRIHKG